VADYTRENQKAAQKLRRKLILKNHPVWFLCSWQTKPNSDVDLLVIMESKLNAHARSAQISEILYPRPFPVDIIVRTPAEVNERLAIGDYFFAEILTQGKVLYERASRR
jgi:hypothetical protein